jgi:hypothetical protein
VLGGFAISFRISVRLRSIRWRRRADSQQLARLLLSEAHAEILIADAYHQHPAAKSHVIPELRRQAAERMDELLGEREPDR